MAAAGYDSRWVNVAYAFQCDADVVGKAPLLLDDAMTTSSTMHSAARALKAAGAESV